MLGLGLGLDEIQTNKLEHIKDRLIFLGYVFWRHLFKLFKGIQEFFWVYVFCRHLFKLFKGIRGCFRLCKMQATNRFFGLHNCILKTYLLWSDAHQLVGTNNILRKETFITCLEVNSLQFSNFRLINKFNPL